MARSLGLLRAFSVLVVLSLSITETMAAYNVWDFGAKPDGVTDATLPFLAAWAAACASSKAADIVVPMGKYLVSQGLFRGPCNNTAVRMFVLGTIVAPDGYSSDIRWITFQYVDGLSVYGGAFDGRGQALWECKNTSQNCPTGATSLTIAESRNVLLNEIKLLNSKFFHMAILDSRSVTVNGARIIAPWNSPNTDGIHVQMSSFVAVTWSTISTGDDCISMGPGTSDVLIENNNCGPGHGISIGSLGRWMENEPGVQNVTVRGGAFTETQNGARIKTWGRPSSSFVKNVTFEDLEMRNVQNPINVDQNYCPGNKDCPGQSSGVSISDVKFINIHGSSATPVAVKLDCSPSNPCTGINLRDVNLTYQNEQASFFCKYANGMSSGVMNPPSCI